MSRVAAAGSSSVSAKCRFASSCMIASLEKPERNIRPISFSVSGNCRALATKIDKTDTVRMARRRKFTSSYAAGDERARSSKFQELSLDEPSFGYILTGIIYLRLSIESGTN